MDCSLASGNILLAAHALGEVVIFKLTHLRALARQGDKGHGRSDRFPGGESTKRHAAFTIKSVLGFILFSNLTDAAHRERLASRDPVERLGMPSLDS